MSLNFFSLFRKAKTVRILSNERDNFELSSNAYQSNATECTTIEFINPVFESQDKELFSKWTLVNCLNLNCAINYIKSDEVKNYMKSVNKTLFILFEITDDFEDLTTQQIEEFSEICSTKSVVALFMSKCHDNFLIYWKSKTIDYFLTLESFKSSQPATKYKNLYKFIVDVLIDSLNNDHLGITDNCTHEKKSFKINLRNLVDPTNSTLIQLCANWGEKELVENLIELEIAKDEPNNSINSQAIALYSKQYEVLYILLQANFSYPKGIDISKCPECIQTFYKAGLEVHEAIKVKNVDKVAKILKKNPKQTHFYNLSNESASKAALARKSFPIYEVLLAHDVTFGLHENFNEIFGQLAESEREIVRKIHFKYSKDLPENHMNILMMNTSISLDELNKEDKEQYIRRAYKILDQDPHLSTILKTVAASKRFEIVFDFNHDSVQVIEAAVDSSSKGSFYTSGQICIGAKQLLDPETEDEFLGTLAHELCHYAVNLTYNNLAKPYLDCDSEAKEEFKRIIEFCKNNCHMESIIGVVFETYSPDMFPAELIVRIPHLLALYRNNPTKLNELLDAFDCLFEFFKEKVILAMTEAIPRIKTKAATEVIRKDKKIWNLRKKLCFSFFLTFVIATVISFFLYDPILKYNMLNSSDKSLIKDSLVTFKGYNVKFRYLFADNSTAYDSLDSVHIKQVLSGQLLNLSDAKLFYLEKLVSFTWETLPDVLKDVVLDSNLKFQNQTLKFQNISKNALKMLTFNQIIKILEGRGLEMGNITTISTEFYVERDFILENVKQVYFHYETYDLDESDFEDYYKNFMEKNVEKPSEILKEIERDPDFKLYSQSYDMCKEQFKFGYTNSSKIINQAEKEQFFILSSGPGAGKTVTFQKLTLDIKKRYPYKWVSYIDIKDHTLLFNSSEEPRQLLMRILRLDLYNEFEKAFFDDLYSSGNVVLLWNGFDEISQDHGTILLELIKNIQKNTKNVQYICTRTIRALQLSDGLNIYPWGLVPFNEIEQKKFLEVFFEFKKFDNATIVRNVNNALKIIEKLNYDKKAVRSFNTPLMLRMIAEINDEESLLDSGNLYEIYDKFIQKKIDIWQEKKRFNQKIDSKIILNPDFDISGIFQKCALLNSLSVLITTNHALKIKKLDIMEQEIRNKTLSNQISEMGILYLNGEDVFEFAHRTYAEFFVAQYLIKYVYNAKSSMSEKEAELRLELFYVLTRRYGYYQEIISEFINSYVTNEVDQKPFRTEIIKVLESKLRNFFISLLDTDKPMVFEFLINFFKKDHNLLLNLLHVNDDETFYTAIFNPNIFAIYVNPKDIENYTKSVLTNKEFQKFTNGRHQRGKILYGMHFHKLMNVGMQSTFYEAMAVNTTFWNFIDILSHNLSIPETKNLFMSIISPKIYMHYDKFFNNSDYDHFGSYENFWSHHEGLLTSSEMKDAISNALLQFIEIYSNNKSNVTNIFFLTHLFKKADKFLSNSDIFEMFKSMCYLHNIQYDAYSFKMFWKFLKNHTTESQRKEILQNRNCNRHCYYVYQIINGSHKNMSSSFYSPMYYDFTSFTILHRTLTVLNAHTFDYTISIYNETFHDLSVIQNIMLDSSDLLYYFVGTVVQIDFKRVVTNMEKLFKGNEKLLENFLEKNIQNTRLSIFEYIDSFREIAGTQIRWFENLQVLQDLRNRIKS